MLQSSWLAPERALRRFARICKNVRPRELAERIGSFTERSTKNAILLMARNSRRSKTKAFSHVSIAHGRGIRLTKFSQQIEGGKSNRSFGRGGKKKGFFFRCGGGKGEGKKTKGPRGKKSA